MELQYQVDWLNAFTHGLIFSVGGAIGTGEYGIRATSHRAREHHERERACHSEAQVKIENCDLCVAYIAIGCSLR